MWDNLAASRQFGLRWSWIFPQTQHRYAGDKQIDNSQHSGAYLLLTGTSLIWAGNAVAGKFAASHVGPLSLTSLRWLIAALIVVPFAWQHLKRDWPVLRSRLPYLCTLGAIGFAGFNIGLYTALQYTTAIFATIAQAAIPMMVMVAGAVILRERVTTAQIIGFLLSVLGIALTVSKGDLSALFRQAVGAGEWLMLGAAILYASYSYLLRYRPPVHWLSFIAVLVCAAAVTALPFGIWEVSRLGLPEPTPQVFAIILYTSVFASLVSQATYAHGVQLIGPTRASLFINAVPVFGAVLAVLLLGETYHWFHAAGLLLVMAGITLAERSGRRIAGRSGVK